MNRLYYEPAGPSTDYLGLAQKGQEALLWLSNSSFPQKEMGTAQSGS